MENQNCWEFMGCGREPDGLRVEELGVCIAATFEKADGFCGGRNGGRACTFIDGTLCTGEIHGTFKDKMKECIHCAFFKTLHRKHDAVFNPVNFAKYVLRKSFDDGFLSKAKGQTLLKEIVARDNMWLPVDSSFHELLRIMTDNTRGVVVILNDNKPVGIITERDIVRMMYLETNLEEKIYPFVQKTLIHTRGERTFSYALSLMLENNIRRLIVTDEENNFLGVVTQKNLLKYMEDDFSQASLKIKHIIDHQRDLIHVARTTTIQEVLKKLLDYNIGSVPVLDQHKPVGIVTENDILRLAEKNVSLDEPIENHMSYPVFCADHDCSVTRVVQEMNKRNVRRVVIKNQAGEAASILTSRDFVKNLEGDYNEFLELKLKYSKEILNLLPEMLIELIDQGDDQLVLWANDKARNVFGEGILDKSISTLVPLERWREIHVHLCEKSKIGNIRFEREKRVYEFSGYYLPLDKKSEKGRIQLIIRDITDEVIRATTDPLTRAFNRRYTNDFMAREVDRSKRFNKQFSITIVDIDDFKKINDQHGHVAGDHVLTSFTECMQYKLRQYDILGRYGGEEFLIVLPELDKDKTTSVIERIRKRVEDLEVKLDNGRKIKLTASFGIASFPEDGDFPKDLLIKADERLYRAKSLGKNQVVS